MQDTKTDTLLLQGFADGSQIRGPFNRGVRLELLDKPNPGQLTRHAVSAYGRGVPKQGVPLRRPETTRTKTGRLRLRSIRGAGSNENPPSVNRTLGRKGKTHPNREPCYSDATGQVSGHGQTTSTSASGSNSARNVPASRPASSGNGHQGHVGRLIKTDFLGCQIV